MLISTHPFKGGFFVDQQFAKIGISKADFPLRTCRTSCGPADVRSGQLTALPILNFDKSGY